MLYRRNADTRLRELERQLSFDPGLLLAYLVESIRSRGLAETDDFLTTYLGPKGNYWRLPDPVGRQLSQIFDLGFMPGVYFEVGVSGNPTLPEFIQWLASELYTIHLDSLSSLFGSCDKIDGEHVAPFAGAQKLNADGIPFYIESQNSWTRRLEIDEDWLLNSMLSFSSIARITKKKTFFKVFVPAWALVCAFIGRDPTTQGFSRSNLWTNCSTSWHTKNLRQRLNSMIDWADSPPRKFTLNGLLVWNTLENYRWNFSQFHLLRHNHHIYW